MPWQRTRVFLSTRMLIPVSPYRSWSESILLGMPSAHCWIDTNGCDVPPARDNHRKQTTPIEKMESCRRKIILVQPRTIQSRSRTYPTSGLDACSQGPHEARLAGAPFRNSEPRRPSLPLDLSPCQSSLVIGKLIQIITQFG